MDIKKLKPKKYKNFSKVERKIVDAIFQNKLPIKK